MRLRPAEGSSDRKTATTGGASLDEGVETWEFWWESNKDTFLDLKSRLQVAPTVSGSPGALTGGGRVPPLVRAFSALSLGLMQDPRGVDTLIGTLETARTLGVS